MRLLSGFFSCALVMAAVGAAVTIAPRDSVAQSMQQNFVIQNGQLIGTPAPSGGGNNAAPLTGRPLELGEEQKLMFEAPNYVFKHDYQRAEQIYSRVLSINGANVEAYIQRGLVRREMGNQQGMVSDGRAAVILSNNALVNNPNNATLYYERSMGFRLLRQFDQARKDMQSAIHISNNSTWSTDLKAIDLEQKIAQSH